MEQRIKIYVTAFDIEEMRKENDKTKDVAEYYDTWLASDQNGKTITIEIYTGQAPD